MPTGAVSHMQRYPRGMTPDQAKPFRMATMVELLTFQGSRLLGQICHLKPSGQDPVKISGSHWEVEAFSAETATACVPAAEQTQRISLLLYK